MGRHKTTDLSDEDRARLYEKYIVPNHSLVRFNVWKKTQKKSEVNDNFQEMCKILLRGIDTYNPEMDISAWIIQCCIREVGKLDAKKPSYVDARKGGDFEYHTPHHGYKKKYRPKYAKDFVNVYDDSVFKTLPSIMSHDGVVDELMKVLQKISPNIDYGIGTYESIEEAVLGSEDTDFIIHFRRKFYGEKIRDIAEIMNISERETKNALSRIKARISKILK